MTLNKPANTTDTVPDEAPILTIIDRVSRSQANIVLERDRCVAAPDAAESDPTAPGAHYRFQHHFPDGGTAEIVASRALVEEGKLAPPCPVCRCKHLYRQRDFNRNLGLGIVVTAGAIGVYLSWRHGTIFPMVGCLLVATVFDWIVYSKMPDVTVCYRCLTCFRNVKPDASIDAYDQHIADGFEFPEK